MTDYPTSRGARLLLPEAGLYAAGTTTAGLEGGTRIGYIGIRLYWNHLRLVGLALYFGSNISMRE